METLSWGAASEGRAWLPTPPSFHPHSVGAAPGAWPRESVPKCTGVGARKGHVTGAESTGGGGYVWLRGVLGEGGVGACGCGHPRGGVPAGLGTFAPESLGWRGEPGAVSGRHWVWAALSLGREARVGPLRDSHPPEEPLGCQGWGLAASAGAGARRRPRNAAGSAPSCNTVFYSRGTGCASAAAS